MHARGGVPGPDCHFSRKGFIISCCVILNERILLSLCPSVFLAEQFESLQAHLDTMMPAAKKPFLQQFYSQASKDEDQ